MGKREQLVAFFSLSSWCLVMVVWLILAVTWVCLRFVIVVFPDHTYLLYILYIEMLNNDTVAFCGTTYALQVPTDPGPS